MTTFQIKKWTGSFFLTLSVLSFTLAFLLLFSFFFTGCSGASGNNANSPTNSASPGGATNAPKGSAWSAVIDGKPLSGTTSNGVAKISLQEDDTMNGLAFQLGYAPPQQQGFQFVISNAATTELRHNNIKTVCNYRDADGTLYIVDSATVTLNPGTGYRTIGTFSGRWKNAHYGKTPANAPETIIVTDGKFDLP